MEGSDSHSPIEVAANGEGRRKGSKSWGFVRWRSCNVSASVLDGFILLVRRDVW